MARRHEPVVGRGKRQAKERSDERGLSNFLVTSPAALGQCECGFIRREVGTELPSISSLIPIGCLSGAPRWISLVA